MRITFTFLLIFSVFNTSLFACFCLPPDYCDYFEEIAEFENKLIFMGTYIQEESVTAGTVAMQFSVDHIYVGEIITPSSPIAINDDFQNTLSTIWMLVGLDDSGCNRPIFSDRAIFALSYNDNFEINGEPFGYVPTVCKNDYFPLNEAADSVNIDILVWGGGTFISLTEFEEEIISCAGEGVSSTSLNNINAEEILIYPNPTADIATIESPIDLSNWKVSVVDASGKEVLQVKGNTLDLQGLKSGVYYVLFRREGDSFVKKVVKVN